LLKMPHDWWWNCTCHNNKGEVDVEKCKAATPQLCTRWKACVPVQVAFFILMPSIVYATTVPTFKSNFLCNK
jgi:hypothetical protein